MLLSLGIENFRSIKSPLLINFTTEKRLNEDDLPYNTFIQNGNEILKCLVLYGRNASGKSNILMALRALSYLITNSDTFKHGEKIAPYEPFIFDIEYKNNPVKFEIDFISVESNLRYKYTISYNSFEIFYEALYFYPENVKAKLYERNKQKITFGDYYRGTKKKLEDDLLPNQLFLSKSSTSKVKYLDDVYLYFTKYFYVSTIHDTEYDKAIIRAFSELIQKDEKLKNNLLELLKAADTSILDFSITENEQKIKFAEGFPEEARKEILERYKYEVLTSHTLFENGKEIGKTTLELENESLGTKKLFAIGSLILDTLDDGGVIVIDELDKGLHPLLTKLIINLFNSKKNNPKNAQLIFATHDSTLLDTEIFRRDQICFVDKDYEGGSVFFKLSDIKGIRKDIPIDKWYLSGRFKAIPVISEPQLKF
ncbi:MAG: AAA family ATPase [Bacteroidetes bacterium]|nr:AAA family ATPase [Bacteroidota bacterium]MBL7103583.1 AAA family ATPase [Bacteroidales bacterium]